MMSDFVTYADDIEDGMNYLEHHGILGQKWGKENGPPYPLGSGDHSSSEKSAAKAAGVKVGSDSGKGSIDKVKTKKTRSKSTKKELTPEEKRRAALEAAKSGDKKKITKGIEELSTDELRDAAERARLKDQLTRKDPADQKMSKSEKDKQDAIRSGDKEKVKQFADKMSYQELSEAMNKIDLMAKLNYVQPPPTAMDRIRDVSQKLGTMKDVAEKGIAAYNVAAKIYNASHKDSQWPIVGEKPKEDKKDDKEKEKTKEAVKQVAQEIKKTYEEEAKERLENKKTDYKYEQEYKEWEQKQKDKASRKAEKKAAKEKDSVNVPKEVSDKKLSDFDDDYLDIYDHLF